MKLVALGAVAVLSLLACQEADAAGGLKLKGKPVAAIIPAASQDGYIGPNTPVGFGGYDPCKGLCTGTATFTESTNYYYAASLGGIVPKNGASKTYGQARAALPASEVISGTDGAGHPMAVTMRADTTIAGNCTARWHDGDSQNSTSGNNQLEVCYSRIAYGEDVAIRGGTEWNTINTCLPGACTVGSSTNFNGAQAFRFSCNITGSTCKTPGNFTGANWKTIRPELGSTVYFGPMTFEDVGVTGTKFTGFIMDKEDETVCWQSGSCAIFIGSAVNASNIWIDNVTIIGNANDTYGRFRIKGIALGAGSVNWTFTNLNISWVYVGISVGQSTGTYPTDVNGTAPSDGFTVTNNIFSNIATDVFHDACMRNVNFSDNIITDKATAVIQGTASTTPPYVNPFASGKQPHADAIQIDYQNGGVNFGCVYRYYGGIKINRNLILRGIGTGDVGSLGGFGLPFWTTPPFPNPNPDGGGVSTPALVPNPSVGIGSQQGIFNSNFAADCGCAPGADGHHYYAGTSGTVPRADPIVWEGAEVKDNFVQTEFQNACYLPDMQNSTVTGNTCISTVSDGVNRATNLTDDTWGLARSRFTVNGLGTGGNTIERNISGGAPMIANVGGSFTGTNVTVDNHNLGAHFQNPGAYGSPRTETQVKAAYLPIRGGSLEVDHSLHIYAGRYCWDGTATGVGGVCPP